MDRPKLRENIASSIRGNILKQGWKLAGFERDIFQKSYIFTDDILVLISDKLPKDKPSPLKHSKISDIVLRCYTDNKLSCVEWAVAVGCQAQREADIKHYEH